MTGIQTFCRRALCVPIRFYQRWISPGLGRNCRFTPTCSAYAIQAIMVHGCVKGLILAVARIARCNPLGRWGFDPVPEKGRWVNPKRILHPAREKKG
ncbi:MAG: membrane protein insertion efficiency factor YidD [Faecalibacterium sp.]